MSQLAKKSKLEQMARTAPACRGREFSIWVVPPSNGRVKKLRLSAGTLFCLCGLVVIAVGTVSYIAGDYARLEIQHAQNYIVTRSLIRERDTLKSANDALEARLNQSRTNQTKRASMNYSVQQRLDELTSVMAKVQQMGVGPVNPTSDALARLNADASKKSSHEKTLQKSGIGGAERDCNPKDLRCSKLELAGEDADQISPSLTSKVISTITYPFRYLYEHSRSLVADEGHAQNGINNDKLIAKLDQSIETLKVIPVSVPAVAEVTSDYGYRHSPFTDHVALHEGMDFGMAVGSKVLSTGDGIVKEVRFNPTYGLVVDVEHTSHVVTRYAHLSKALVHEGESVARGTELGLSGSSGRSTGPHLHYEVRIDGEPRDPKQLIALGQQLSAYF